MQKVSAVASLVTLALVPLFAVEASGQDPHRATKLGSFEFSEGSLVTLGREDLGEVGGVEVDVRQLSDSTSGTSVSGLLVIVTGGFEDDGVEGAFVDADELPELVAGLDALLAISANPTPFERFEVSYTTRGALELAVVNDRRDERRLRYAVRAGQITTAAAFLNAAEMGELRGMFVAAQQKLEQP